MAKNKRTTLGIASSADDDWQTESDLRTLIEAEKIEADPKRLAKAQALAKKRMLEVAKVASEGKDAS